MTTEQQPQLAGFLAARLDEDEAAAKAAARGPGKDWRNVILPGRPRDGCLMDDDGASVIAWFDDHAEAAGHAARYDPRRVLREIAAMRRILALAGEATDLDMQVDHDRRVGERDEVQEPYIGDLILRAILAIWDDNPDYDQGWAPR